MEFTVGAEVLSYRHHLHRHPSEGVVPPPVEPPPDVGGVVVPPPRFRLQSVSARRTTARWRELVVVVVDAAADAPAIALPLWSTTTVLRPGL